MTQANEAQAPEKTAEAPASEKPRKQYDLRGTIKTVGGYENPKKDNEVVPEKTVMVLDIPFEYNEQGFGTKLKDFAESLGVKAKFGGEKYNNTWSIVVPDQETAQEIEQMLYESGGKMLPCTGAYYQNKVNENQIHGHIQGLASEDGSPKFQAIVGVGFDDRKEGYNETLKEMGAKFDGRLEVWTVDLDETTAPQLNSLPIDWAQDFDAVCSQELGLELPERAQPEQKAPVAPQQPAQQQSAPGM